MDLQALPDEAVIPRKEKGFGEEKEMKKGLYYSLHLFPVLNVYNGGL